MAQVRIANNILEELTALVTKGQPAFSTSRGQLFIGENLPMAAIRLNVSVDDYIGFLASLPVAERPNIAKVVIGIDGKDAVQVVINGRVTVTGGRIAIDGTPATVL